MVRGIGGRGVFLLVECRLLEVEVAGGEMLPVDRDAFLEGHAELGEAVVRNASWALRKAPIQRLCYRECCREGALAPMPG